MELITVICWAVVTLTSISMMHYLSMRADNKSLSEDNRRLRNEVAELEKKIFDMRIEQIHNTGFVETGKAVMQMWNEVLEDLEDAK